MKKIAFFIFSFVCVALQAQEKPTGAGLFKIGTLTESELNDMMIQQGKIEMTAIGDEDFFQKMTDKNAIIKYEPNLKNLDDNIVFAYFLKDISVLNAVSFKLNEKYNVENGFFVFSEGKLVWFMLDGVDNELFEDFHKKYGDGEKKKIVSDAKCAKTVFKKQIVYEVYKNDNIETTLSKVYTKDKNSCEPNIQISITGENIVERSKLDDLNEKKLQELEQLELDKL